MRMHFAGILLGILTSCALSQLQEDYLIVIDGGSTGSRGFIFKFYNGNKINITQGKKITPGISSFLDNPQGLSTYFEPILLDAAEHIPVECQSKTPVFILGTAGMRLLPEEHQQFIWDHLFDELTRSSFPFLLNKENLRTIDGKSEAYYAVIATNFIAGRIGVDLIPNGDMIGALDMGGSSTQMVFHTGTNANEKVQPDHFWSHSWLSFGAEKIQERVWSSLLESHRLNSASDETTLYNPCLFKGYRTLHHFNESVPSAKEDGSSESVQKFIFMEGTGEAMKCRDIIRQTLWPEGCQPGGPCAVENIQHPPVDGLFFGISVYFFALDCVRHFGKKELPHWPNPSIDDLEDASLQFCEIPWNEIYSSHQQNSHQMTNEDKLPNRCVEALYITTLLEDGFGFRGTHRGITLALEVDGTEVEWTLGFALAEELLESLHSNGFVSSEALGSSPSSDKTDLDSNKSTSETETTTGGGSQRRQKEEDREGEKEKKKMSSPVLQFYFSNTKSFLSQRMKSFLKLWSQLSIAKVSSLLVNALKALTHRIQFTIDLVILKPTKLFLHALIQFFAKAQQNLHEAGQLIHQKLPPSLVRILPFPRGGGGVKSSQNSSTTPPS